MPNDENPLSALFTAQGSQVTKAKWWLTHNTLHFEDELSFCVLSKNSHLICEIIHCLDMADDFPNPPHKASIGLAFLALDELKRKIRYERNRRSGIQTRDQSKHGSPAQLPSDDAAPE